MLTLNKTLTITLKRSIRLEAKNKKIQKELAKLGVTRLDFKKVVAIVQLFNEGYKVNSIQRGHGAERLQSLGFSTTNFYTLQGI